MASTPILPLAVWQSGTNQNSIPANDNALRIEALNRELVSQSVTAQPASPADGDTYIIASTHTGAQWASFTPKDIAIYKSGTWYAWAPTEGIVLNVAGTQFKFDGGVWVAASAGGMTNPMTTTGDIIYSSSGSTPARLGVGTNGYVLTLASGVPTWAASTGGFSNPMTTAGDLILGGTSGAPGRLAIGSNGQVLTVTGGAVGWAAASSGFTNPMTTVGDLIVGGASGAAGRLAAGTATYVLTSNGAGVAPTWQAAGGGGGLTYITESLDVATPNATNNVVTLRVTGGSSSAFLALVPKGSSSGLLAAIPDNTATGGNARGNRSVDWQQQRNAADHVAGAQGSVLSGGIWNKISTSANYSVICGGFQNSIDSGSGGHNVIIGGTLNTITSTSGKNTILGGESNSLSASGLYNLMGGYSNSITAGESSVVVGRTSTTASSFSFVSGLYAKGRTTQGARVQASGKLLNDGDAQYERYILSRITTSATPLELTTTQAGISTSAIPVLTSGSAMAFTATVITRNPSTGDCASWTVSGMIKNSSGTVSLVGTPAVTLIASDSSLTACAVTVGADNTNKGLLISGTGLGSTTLRWVATVHASFVG